MAGGKKLGGILVEGMASGHLIIGIGVNLAIIPEDMRDRATSIYHETGKMIERDQFSAAVLQELDRFYLAYLGRF
jgi:BirA family biotin operon repressor/biotin-[acetyl-CoA-carboxylase] ligase